MEGDTFEKMCGGPLKFNRETNSMEIVDIASFQKIAVNLKVLARASAE